MPGFGYGSGTPFLPLLSPAGQGCFKRWAGRHAQQLDAEEAALRAILAGQPEPMPALPFCLHPPRTFVGVSVGMQRRCQQNNSIRTS